MFLTEDELRELTGRERPSAQTRWLTAQRWPFALDSSGRPKVLRSVVETKLGGHATIPREPALRLA